MNIIFFSDAGNFTFKYIFSGVDYLCFFSPKGNIIYEHLYIYTENIMFPCIFWERSSFIFLLKEKYHIFWGKKVPSLQILQNRSYSSVSFLERPSFQNIWRKHISCIFLRNITFLFRLKNKIIFSGKTNIIFPNNTRKTIFQYDFWKKKNLKKEIWFFVQWQLINVIV